MSKVYEWYNSLSKQIRDSIGVTTTLVSIISSVLSIIGISLGSNGTINIWIRIFIVLTVYFLIFIISYGVIRKIFKNQITLNIRQTSVSIREGEDDRFEAKKSMLDAYPNLRGMYDENDGNTQVFYMKNATATFCAFGKAPEVVEF